MRSIPAFVIAGTHSGAGKTTVSLGIMAALQHRGMKVQPFKIGPDFIDPGLHAEICGVPSYNLDGWMLSRDYNRRSFRKNVQDKDVAVVEGMMGLYDGRSGATEEGSTAEMAKQLELPVVLVLDAAAMARSAAAMILGYCQFDPKVRLIGVIFNRVAGKGHLQYLKEAFRSLPGLKCFGGIPIDDRVTIPERHLGLTVAKEGLLNQRFIERLARLIETHVELNRLLASARTKIAAPAEAPLQKLPDDDVPIAVANDRAFCFYYPDNLELLRSAGAKIKNFSPIHDHRLPEGVQGIYLGGGYPEIYAKELSRNRSMRLAIRDFIETGGPVYAECGGLMYLAKALTDCGKRHHPMVGAYPFKTRMLPRLKALGYREILSTKKTFIARGKKMRGHEFHYSEIYGSPGAKAIETAYLFEGPGKTKLREGYRYKNCLGSYVHLHFGSNPRFARSFVAACRSTKQ
ncbi:MAG: cobyrinate a,c-diamide synthase [Deltaproteobacteria bacterium]|nr:cobyrinate a,c-diamide synthase [Deltaproteobacteria bacterium]